MALDYDNLMQGGTFGEGRDPKYLANLFLRLVRDLRECKPPPEEIPAELYDAFTMNGQMAVQRVWRDDTILRIVNERDPEEIRKLAFLIYVREYVDNLVRSVKAGGTFHYGVVDTWLHQALADHPIAGAEVAVLGSGAPVYEAFALANGGRPLTVEYQPRISDHPDLTFISPDEFARLDRKMGAALSISSFEHDGLGRYGDPLDPDGDFKAMDNLRDRMAPGGKLFLGVPLGPDLLMWNVNRVYGPKRLPQLLRGWRCLGIYGAPDGILSSLSPFVIDEDAWNAYFAENQTHPHWILVLEPAA